MSKTPHSDADLNDDAFGDQPGHQPHEHRYDDPDADQNRADTYDDEEYEDEAEPEETAPSSDDKAHNDKRKRTAIVLALGLLAVLGIGGFLWKMTGDANGFRARAVPVPAEPIDMAEKAGKRRQQPTDYADEEQMRTMNYDGVNSIYGLTLKRQEANRIAAKDSARQNPTVARELARSRQLSAQRPTRPNHQAGAYGSNNRRYGSGSAYSGGGGNPYSGRSSAYGDPYGANPTREQVLLQAGFNTVKAERSSGDGYDRQNYGSPQTLPPASLATAEVEDDEPIPGVVSGDQTIMNGTRVMFRTLADAKIRDRFAPKGSILVGFAQVGSNRAVFNITTLRLSTGEAVPVRLRALDPDMNEGLALQSDKPAKQQVDQATGSALSQAAGQAAWSAGYSVNRATRSAVAGNALASLGAGLATAATTGRRREARQKLNLQDGFKVFFVPYN